MTKVKNLEIELHRANVYKTLSHLYYQPHRDTVDLLYQLEKEVSFLSLNLVDVVQKMVPELLSDKLNHLEVEHAKLFIGPFDVLASPYSSVYLDGERRVMGNSTMKVLDYYQQAGLKIDDSFIELPDHISAELEFVYYLIFKSLEDRDYPIYNEVLQSFLKEHLGLWVPIFTVRMMERSTSLFYYSLGLITKSIVNQHVNELI